MGRRANVLRSIAASYAILVVFCLLALALLWVFVNNEIGTGQNRANVMQDYVAYAPKIIKLVSFGLIALQIVNWMLGVNPESPEVGIHRFLGKLAIIVTLCAILYYALRVGAWVTTLHSPSFIWYLFDSVVAIIPIAILMLANGILMHRAGDGERKSFRYFFYIVDLPIIFASVAIFLLALVMSKFVPLERLPAMVGGAMAFLVFAAHCTEKVLELIIHEEASAGKTKAAESPVMVEQPPQVGHAAQLEKTG